MPYCVNCGTSYLDGSKYCGNCGKQTEVPDNPGGTSAPAAQVLHASRAEIVLWEGKPSGLTDRMKEVAHVNSTTYKVTNQRIIVKSGLIGKKTEEIELIGVKDISVEQSLADRLLGVGSITILSMDQTTPEMILDDVKDVQTVKDIIRKAVREEKAAHNINYREHI
jgi:hypothetical protein